MELDDQFSLPISCMQKAKRFTEFPGMAAQCLIRQTRVLSMLHTKMDDHSDISQCTVNHVKC